MNSEDNTVIPPPNDHFFSEIVNVRFCAQNNLQQYYKDKNQKECYCTAVGLLRRPFLAFNCNLAINYNTYLLQSSDFFIGTITIIKCTVYQRPVLKLDFVC